MKRFFWIGLFFAVILFFSTDLFALNFQIDQAKVRVKMPIGWSDGGVVNVENRDKDPIRIRVYAADWVYSGQDGSKNFMPAGTLPNSAVDWIKFYPADFTIPGLGKQKVNYVVGIPQGASGGHYAVLFFEVEVGQVWDNTKGVNVKVYNRIGSLFSVEPEESIKREAKVSDFKIKESSGIIEAEANFENIGNIDIPAKGTIDIINDEGLVFTRGKFDEAYTMPGDKAKIYVKIPSVQFSQGKYDVILTVDLEGGILVKEYQMIISGGKIAEVKEIE